MQHAIVVFRIKWVWIWLRLSGTRVPSRGAFFGRIDYPRFQKKKKSQSQPVSGGATEQDSDISQRMSSPTPLSEPEIIVELRFLTVNDEHI